jgi:NAD(P)-dependent dehydrogenase (short-subunit alcohol dehydrogenase family)
LALKYSAIDGLVNCAGIFASRKPFPEISLAEWDKVIATNLTGTFLMSKYVSQKMIEKQKGKIVNISCIRSRVVNQNMAEYAASKGAIVALTAAMAVDLAKYNIQVNSVAPGTTYSEITEKKYSNPDLRKERESQIPMKRIANPTEIANVVLFLLSDLANYVTGETIFVDGGFKIFK